MPWTPLTDFQQEVVNLQPHHDFLSEDLSEAHYNYPRPKAHTEYAANKKLQNKVQPKEYEMGRIIVKNRSQQMHPIANIKSDIQLNGFDECENVQNIEKEAISMMRYCGIGISVEQPLNEKVTFATYPVENSIKVVKNGRRTVALFFDENVFKLKDKVSDTSCSFGSQGHKLKNSENNSLDYKLNGETSFNTSSSSLSLKSFSGEREK